MNSKLFFLALILLMIVASSWAWKAAWKACRNEIEIIPPMVLVSGVLYLAPDPPGLDGLDSIEHEAMNYAETLLEQVYYNPEDHTAWKRDGSGWLQLTTAYKGRHWTIYEDMRNDPVEYTIGPDQGGTWFEGIDIDDPDFIDFGHRNQEHYIFYSSIKDFVKEDDKGFYLDARLGNNTYKIRIEK